MIGGWDVSNVTMMKMSVMMVMKMPNIQQMILIVMDLKTVRTWMMMAMDCVMQIRMQLVRKSIDNQDGVTVFCPKCWEW